jgi:hypothetical protein
MMTWREIVNILGLSAAIALGAALFVWGVHALP